jgi:NTE family protein
MTTPSPHHPPRASSIGAELARTPLFEGLDVAALDEIYRQMQPRRFDARTFICREGEPGSSLLVIQRGLAQVLIQRPEGPVPVARLRHGDVVGEISLLTGEPRSASVLATVPTDVLELRQDAFASLVARHPTLLANLSRILSHRLVRTNVRQAESRRRGEAIALVVGQHGAALAPAVIAATQAASPRSVVALDLGVMGNEQPTAAPTSRPALLTTHCSRLEDALASLDDLLAAHGTVVAVADVNQENLPFFLEQMDRVILLLEDTEAKALAPLMSPAAASIDLVLLTDRPDQAPAIIAGLRVVRALDLRQSAIRNPQSAIDHDVAWLGRHLSRTKLGLAMGAGGAKGYAHVGALHVLEDAGYTVDYVAGSSIGGMVGAWLAMGRNAEEVEATMRGAFTPEKVEATFRLSFAGTSAGHDVHARICQETTEGRSFSELAIPLVVMAVDLNTRQPAPITEGPVWEALLATTALAGLFPPYQRGEQRLVDGLHLVPVPTGSVIEAGADVTVSVNIISHETLPAWPGQSPPEPQPASRGSRMLDTLLDVMDMGQLDASVRHAALADVVITPRFGPASWREFHLADLFLAAGREAAEAQLESLRSLARPQG